MRILFKLLRRLFWLALALVLAAGGLLAFQGYRMYRQALDGQSLETALSAVRSAPGYTPIDQLPEQVAKNLFFTQEKQFARKIAEVFMAFRLEDACTKDEILELYVNTIYFGDGYYGIRDACAGYFGKEPAALTPYEATLLAGIPNAPSVYSLTANPDLAARRQRYVVGQMVKYGRLTADEAAAITAP